MTVSWSVARPSAVLRGPLRPTRPTASNNTHPLMIPIVIDPRNRLRTLGVTPSKPSKSPRDTQETPLRDIQRARPRETPRDMLGATLKTDYSPRVHLERAWLGDRFVLGPPDYGAARYGANKEDAIPNASDPRSVRCTCSIPMCCMSRARPSVDSTVRL